MVDSIHGPGKTIIITTKPKAKESVEKKGSFDEALKDKTSSTERGGHAMVSNPAQNNLKIMQQQQVIHMQRLQEIAKQVADGTYKMVDPAVLAEKIYQVMTDRPTREKFIKKMIQEEVDKMPAKDRGKITDLEFKKLVFMIKESQDEPFDDPELEKLIKDFA